MSSPAELYEAGRGRLPAWNDAGEDAEARQAEAIALITQAAEAGHLEAIRHLVALDRSRGLAWAIALAQRGDVRELVVCLTSQDFPPEACAEVLIRARAGEPWAQLAISGVYGLGLRDGKGRYVVSQPGAFGWLPAAAKPAVERRAWLERAAATGWPPAELALAEDDAEDEPEVSLARTRRVLGTGALVPEQQRRAARLLLELLEATDAPIGERLDGHRALAEADEVESILWLAEHHAEGMGTARDLVAARALWERGAALGSAVACRELGRCCEEGRGGAVDLERARELYELAAELGADAFARDRLAERFGLTWYARRGKPASRKPASKKPASKKPASKKPASKRPASKKPASKKPATKKPAGGARRSRTAKSPSR